jgi:multiple sugar transport system substrate-binding protein
MKKSLKLFPVILAAIFILSTFTGFAKTASSRPAEKTIKLRFAVWDYSLAPEYKEVIDAFQAENPNIKVEALDTPATGYNDKLTIMLASGDTTDVIALKDMPSYSNYVQKKQIVNLINYMIKDRMNVNDYQGLAGNLKINGMYYALPYRSDFWVLYYNKDLFDKAKVAYPTNNMTWTDFRNTAKKLTSGSGNNQVYGAYIHTWKSAVIDWAVADGKGTLTDGKYEFLKPAYDVFLPMQNVDKSIMPLGIAKASSANYKGQFETGKAALLPMGTWFLGTLITDKKNGLHNVNWGVATIPHFDKAKQGTTFGNVTPVAINSLSKNKDAAWKFVKFISSEKAAMIFAKHGIMPAYRNEAVMKVFNSLDGLPAGSQEALKTTKVALEFPPNVKGAAIDKILQEEHELIMINNNSVDAGIATMNKRVQEVLNSK